MVRADNSFDESLHLRLREIAEALRPLEPLLEERRQIEILLQVRGSAPQPGTAQPIPVAAKPTPRVVGVPYPSRPIRTDTKTARLLEHARKMLWVAPDSELPFMPLFESIPSELLGDGRHMREHFRGILQRAGDRVGIEYVNSGLVRLMKKSASLTQSAPSG